MSQSICVGVVVDVYVLRVPWGREHNRSGGDFEDEIMHLSHEESDMVTSVDRADDDEIQFLIMYQFMTMM